jgi:hypothetical protein
MAATREEWAQRLYRHLPEVYRSLDLRATGHPLPPGDGVQAAEPGPLLALLRAIAGQAAALRDDMDDLWDNFFIETCDEWVVPYIGALVGTNLLPNPVGQTNRLDVRNTIEWRRSKGTPRMLARLAAATTGWQVDLVEFFETLAWAQNLNHVRLDRALAADLRHPTALDRLGYPDDPFAHLLDVSPAIDLDGPPAVRSPAAPAGTRAVVRTAFSTPGRYNIKNLGFFARRLMTFPVRGATPSPRPATTEVASYTFDPLGRDVALFALGTSAPITRAHLAASPADYFGPAADLAVRRFGVPLATGVAQPSNVPPSVTPFQFATAPLRLDPVAGLRLLEPERFRLGSIHFRVAAVWRTAAGDVDLGFLDTLEAGLGNQAAAFHPGSVTPALGQLVIRLATGTADAAVGRAAAGPGRFPATVLAVRDDAPLPRAALEAGSPSTVSAYGDALLVFLPEVFLAPGQPLDLYAADDGSTYFDPSLANASMARASTGQVWPPSDLSRPSTRPTAVGRRPHRRIGLQLADETLFSERFKTGLLVETFLLAGVQVPQLSGALITVDRQLATLQPGQYDELALPPGTVTWPRFEFFPSRDAVADQLVDAAVVALRIGPLDAGATPFSPPFEVVLTDREGSSMVVYIPEVWYTPGTDAFWFLIADDGSSYRTSGVPHAVDDLSSFPGGSIGRIGAGQVLPMEGVYPLQRRSLSVGRVAWGRLAVDPERGRFCLPKTDPLLAVAGADADLSVDYVEAFGDRIGARAFDHGLDPSSQPTLVVAAHGDAAYGIPLDRIYDSLSNALNAASSLGGEQIIEIADSATYVTDAGAGGSGLIDMSGLSSLVIRAAGVSGFARPCLAMTNSSAAAGPLRTLTLAAGSHNPRRLELSGLLVGGPVEIDGYLPEIVLTACTLATSDAVDSLVLMDQDPSHDSHCLLCRCSTGPLRVGQGIARLTIADSIVDRGGGIPPPNGSRGLVIGGLVEGADLETDQAARAVQLERVTVLGRVRAETLVASESLLGEAVKVDDRQVGCLRFCRIEREGTGSLLVPRRYRCVPSDEDVNKGNFAHAVFTSLSPAAAGYAQLGPASSSLVLTASEQGDEVGAFASALPGVRLGNMHSKLLEFLPIGLNAVVIAQT